MRPAPLCPMFARRWFLSSAAPSLAACLAVGPAAGAQVVQPQPVTDSSTQASPLTPVRRSPVDDGSAQASPVSPERLRTVLFAPGTSIPVRLNEPVDSGHLKNGQSVAATLTSPVPVQGGDPIPAGTPVGLSVISTVPAGVIAAVGELSLQALRVGIHPVLTEVLVFAGKPGHKDLPDSAPALGTDAGMPQGTALTFHIQPAPTAALSAPPKTGKAPGSIDAIESGDPPPPNAAKSYGAGTTSGSGNTPGQQQKSVSPADTTSEQGTQNAGKVSVAPNQPQKPSQPPSTGPNTPH